MNMNRAIKALGINRARYEVQNMALALVFGSYLNTEAERERLEAANFVLKRWKAYCKACNEARDAMHESRLARLYGKA